MEFAHKPGGGLLIPQHPFFAVHWERIVALAERHRLPAVYAHTFFAEIGGLVSVGVNLRDMWQGAAGFVDRILRGTKPSELPVQEPITPDIVVNLKTARNLKVTIGPQLR